VRWELELKYVIYVKVEKQVFLMFCLHTNFRVVANFEVIIA